MDYDVSCSSCTSNLTHKTPNNPLRPCRDGVGLTKAYNGTRSFPWHYGISRVRFHMVTCTGCRAVATSVKVILSVNDSDVQSKIKWKIFSTPRCTLQYLISGVFGCRWWIYLLFLCLCTGRENKSRQHRQDSWQFVVHYCCQTKGSDCGAPQSTYTVCKSEENCLRSTAYR